MSTLADYVFCSTTQINSEEEGARQDDPAEVGDKSKSDEHENHSSRNQKPPPSLTTNRTVDSSEHRILNAASTGDGTIAENRYQSQFSKHHDNNSTSATKEYSSGGQRGNKVAHRADHTEGNTNDSNKARQLQIITDMSDVDLNYNESRDSQRPTAIKIPAPIKTDEDTCENSSVNLTMDNDIASPKYRMDHLAAPYSPREFQQKKNVGASDEFVDNPPVKIPFKEQHVQWFHRGIIKTLLPVLCGILALSMSIWCKHSVTFVSLDIPFEVGNNFDDIEHVGLFFVEICRADEFVEIDNSNGLVIVTKYKYADNKTAFEHPTDMRISQLTTDTYYSESSNTQEFTRARVNKVCDKLRLDSNLIGDGLWNFTRIVAGATEWLGGFLILMLLLSCFWKTMNMIPIGIGLLLTYSCQGLVFVFFESGLCKKYGCIHSRGTFVAISALVFWFFAWVGVLSMILDDRHAKHMKVILEKKRDIAAAVYDEKKREHKKRRFLHNQFSFMKLFTNSRRENRSNMAMASPTCDTSGSDEPRCGPGCSCCGLEI